MYYDPATGEIHAVGNVHMTRHDGELSGDKGKGTAAGRDFELHGNVHGYFKTEDLTLVCNDVIFETESTTPQRRKISASGDVEMTRGKDNIVSQTLVWHLDRDAYRAAGRVKANFEQYRLDADEAARDNEKFWSRNIRRYEDRVRKITMSADKANGIIRGQQVVEMIAEGRVVMTSPDDQGKVSTITGNKAVYSVARGTIVVTGNASVTQEGRRLAADDLVYHLGSGRVDAYGTPSLVIDAPKETQ